MYVTSLFRSYTYSKFFSQTFIFMVLFSAGKISLDNVFQERERLNHNIVGKRIPPLTTRE